MKDTKKNTKEQKIEKAQKLMTELNSLELTDEELKEASGGKQRRLDWDGGRPATRSSHKLPPP